MKQFVTKDSVYVRSNNNTYKIMKHLLIALIPIVLFAFYKNGIYPFINGDSNFVEMLYPIIFITTGVLTNIIIEAAYDYIILGVKKEKLKEEFAYIYQFIRVNDNWRLAAISNSVKLKDVYRSKIWIEK